MEGSLLVTQGGPTKCSPVPTRTMMVKLERYCTFDYQGDSFEKERDFINVLYRDG